MVGVIEGRMVHYVLTDYDAEAINKGDGNKVEAGQHVAATIVRVWSKETGMVNLRAHLDGPFDKWITSVPFGNGPRAWHWIEKDISDLIAF